MNNVVRHIGFGACVLTVVLYMIRHTPEQIDNLFVTAGLSVLFWYALVRPEIEYFYEFVMHYLERKDRATGVVYTVDAYGRHIFFPSADPKSRAKLDLVASHLYPYWWGGRYTNDRTASRIVFTLLQADTDPQTIHDLSAPDDRPLFVKPQGRDVPPPPPVKLYTNGQDQTVAPPAPPLPGGDGTAEAADRSGAV